MRAIDFICGSLLVVGPASWCAAEEIAAATRYRERIQPILETYCYGCHGYGANEGGRTFDAFESDAALLADRQLWWAVLKNVRAGIMPPAGEEQPSHEERQALLDWIKVDAFGVDPADPDPGCVTIRRLNRVEYRNTIRDLTGVDFDTDNEFPADDSGYGFDNIGDVLSMSPLLLEKYLQAAEQVVERAVPKKPRSMAEQRVVGDRFRSDDGAANGSRMSYYTAAIVEHDFRAKKTGTYRIAADLELDGKFEFDPGRCRVTFSVDGEEAHEAEYGWADNEPRRFEVEVKMAAGKRRFAFRLEPLVEPSKQVTSLDFRIHSVAVRGPAEDDHLVEDANYRRFFPKGRAPADPEERDLYAREVLEKFARRAYRRPVDEATLDRLVKIAKETYGEPGESFEYGIGRAMVAVLASPRFLFRVEDASATADNKLHPTIDEHSLASRMSYFLWSSMPDDELLELADRGELRANLDDQLKRMLKDPRSKSLAVNFAGQWLRSRDVEHSDVDPIEALGLAGKWEALRDRFWKLREARDEEAEEDGEGSEDVRKRDEERAQLRAEFQQLREIREMFNSDLRNAMRRETEMHFEYVAREDRSVLELIDCDYTFLNQALAKHYGIEGVTGREMRRVDLPEGSPRGGVLTQGTLLVVTSNPTRTSPVKRGLYILDNILGTPPPPAPPNVPPLEAANVAVADREPTIRELQEQHRRDPLCHSCHARMDPLGLALENFNALGMWRDSEHGQPIDASGELMTGEKFGGIDDVKGIILNERRLDFYRCITEKLLTYALGRGLEYYDEHTVDQIVDRMEREQGKFSTLLKGIVDSAPFQRQRRAEGLAEAR